MYTLEEKIEIALRYIATDDDSVKAELRAKALEALELESSTPTPIPSDVVIEEMIHNLLRRAGCNCRLTGYDYLVRSIKLALSDRTYAMTGNVTKRLYPDVAKQANSTASRVERAMRHCITLAFERADWQDIVALYGNTINVDRGCLTNSEFISFCELTIRRELQRNA